jgi:RES domain-containing protein
MIAVPIGPDAVFYRVLTPRWSHQPLSGAGAAHKGGRLNRPGLHALYLSDAPETALAEYQQTDPLLKPGTIASYQTTLASVVDFRSGYDPAVWDPAWDDFWCEWRSLYMAAGIDPPSWLLGDMALAAGHRGILFPSVARPGAHNLVVFVGHISAEDRLAVYDPEGALPKTAASWAGRNVTRHG